MQQPKFKVGEVVILQSKKHPTLNGEYTIREIVWIGEETYDRILKCKQVCGIKGGNPFTDGKFFSYKFEELVTTQETLDGRRREGVWSESALRKKHQPGEMNFHSLMDWMKQPAKA